MKITVFLIFAAIIHASASTYAQKLTLHQRNINLKQLFTEIRKQTGYDVLYQPDKINFDQTFNADFNDTPLTDVLKFSLKEQRLDFVIEDQTVVIRERHPTDNPNDLLTPVDGVTGRVQDKSGLALPGATILVKRLKRGSIADAKGDFYLKEAKIGDTLLVSYIGYQSRIVVVKDQTFLFVKLEETNNKLDQVMVQGYGFTTQRLTTGDIGKVTAAEIEKQPLMNPLLALRGKIAGLDISQTNGYASAPVKVELRGRASIAGFPSDPLYVIDGVPLTILDIGGYTFLGNATASSSAISTGFVQNGSRGLNGPANGQSPLFSLNPSDIASIEVLKDADATSIYGSRGANGVVLITTKKGRIGKTKLEAHLEQGYSRVSRYYPLLNTSQYIQVRKQAFANDNINYKDPANAGKAYDLLAWDTTRNVDWQRELYGGTGKRTDAQVALSGGDALTSFRIGAGYDHTKNITTVSGADQKASLSFNLGHHTNDQKFNVNLSGSYSYSQSDMISLPGIITYAPDAPAIFDENGNLNYAGWTNQSGYPFASLKQPYTAKTNFLNSSLVFNYEPWKGFKTALSFGYNNAQNNQTNFLPIASLDPGSNPTGQSNFGTTNNKNWIVEPQISYETFIGVGKLSVLAGASAQQANTDATIISGRGYTSDALLKTISNAPVKDVFENYGEYKYAALFGRVSYNFENKYLINLGGRRDGSSRFGSDRQFGNFWSAGAAWIFTEEKIVKEHLTFLSFGKLRASYGTTGSDAVGDYQYLTRWSSNNTFNYTGIQPLVPLQHANPDYRWQVNKKLEGGLELGFVNDKITLNTSYYRNRTNDQLVGFPTPAFSGFTSVTANSPALVQNSGWEVTVSAKIIDGNEFKWSANFNTAFNKNKLISYPNFEQSPYVGIYRVGYPLNMVYLYHYTGVDPGNGQFTFEDKNHDGQITYNNKTPGVNDDVSAYDLNPKFIGGLGMNFSYKRLQLDMFFTIKKQNARNAIDQGNIFPGGINNFPSSQLAGVWRKPGDIATSARFTTQPNQSDINFTQSDGAYSDASFLRLTNVSLSYSLPVDWTKKAGMTVCNLFIHADNLFTITNYKGVDPETQNFGGLPPIRTIVAGISFNY